MLCRPDMRTVAVEGWRAGSGAVVREIRMVGDDGCGGRSWQLIICWRTSSNGPSEVMPLAIEVEFLLAQIWKPVSV